MKVTFTATESGTAVGLNGCLRFDGSSLTALQVIDDLRRLHSAEEPVSYEGIWRIISRVPPRRNHHFTKSQRVASSLLDAIL